MEIKGKAAKEFEKRIQEPPTPSQVETLRQAKETYHAIQNELFLKIQFGDIYVELIPSEIDHGFVRDILDWFCRLITKGKMEVEP